MSKMKKGQKLACFPCGREVIIDSCGVSKKTIWCCGKPMKAPGAAIKKTKPVKKKK